MNARISEEICSAESFGILMNLFETCRKLLLFNVILRVRGVYCIGVFTLNAKIVDGTCSTESFGILVYYFEISSFYETFMRKAVYLIDNFRQK